LQAEADATLDGVVRLRNFIEYVYHKTYGMKIIDALAREFASVDVLSHYGGYYKLRCPRNEKTIGSIFGMIESRKEEFLISEYAVSQTTLEQIFQTFAEASIDDEACWSFDLDSRNAL
jgi:hypothetical protein